jgi:hypothetical protein
MLRQDKFVRDRFVKVLDFGLAKLPIAKPDCRSRSVRFRSPRQSRRDHGHERLHVAEQALVKTSTSVEFLVSALCFMKGGREPPFKGKTEVAPRVSIIDHDPQPL